jgi:NTP pyrophosphatase (non-canonical NTP hydrolase)
MSDYQINQNVIDAITAERQYQRNKWGVNKYQSLEGYLLILQREIGEAIEGWNKNVTFNRSTALEEVVQVAAVAVACLEAHGLHGNDSEINPELMAALRNQQTIINSQHEYIKNLQLENEEQA